MAIHSPGASAEEPGGDHAATARPAGEQEDGRQDRHDDSRETHGHHRPTHGKHPVCACRQEPAARERPRLRNAQRWARQRGLPGDSDLPARQGRAHLRTGHAAGRAAQPPRHHTEVAGAVEPRGLPVCDTVDQGMGHLLGQLLARRLQRRRTGYDLLGRGRRQPRLLLHVWRQCRRRERTDAPALGSPSGLSATGSAASDTSRPARCSR